VIFGVSYVIVIWTVIAALTALFSGAMIGTRIRNLRALYRDEDTTDLKYRVFYAHQDIRRSVMRCLASLVAFLVGAWLWLLETGHLLEYRELIDWPWGLIFMAFLIFVNESLDRWALHWIRRETRRDTGRKVEL
jgi:Na+/pantothenate symporter